MRETTDKRIKQLRRRVGRSSLPPVLVVWADSENPNLLTVNGENISRPEFEVRYPGPRREITWDDSDEK